MNAVVSPSRAVPELIAQTILGLCQTVTTRVRAATVTQAQLTYVVGRLLGIRKRFQWLVALIRAGTPPKERTRRERPARAAPEPEVSRGFPPPPGWRRWAVRAEKPVPTWRSLGQHRFGWVLPLAPSALGFCGSAASHREELLRLLAEPETRALLLASRRVGDVLRPLCWMLGIEMSVLYPAPLARGTAVLAPDPVGPPPDKNDVPAVERPGPVVRGGADSRAGWPPRAREGGEFFATA